MANEMELVSVLEAKIIELEAKAQELQSMLNSLQATVVNVTEIAFVESKFADWFDEKYNDHFDNAVRETIDNVVDDSYIENRIDVSHFADQILYHLDVSGIVDDVVEHSKFERCIEEKINDAVNEAMDSIEVQLVR